MNVNRHGSTCLLPIYRRRVQIGCTLVDPDIACSLDAHRWTVTFRGYVVTSIAGVTVTLHRLVMGTPVESDPRHTHHRNGDPFDNRRENLELVTASEHVQRHKAMRKEAVA